MPNGNEMNGAVTKEEIHVLMDAAKIEKEAGVESIIA